MQQNGFGVINAKLWFPLNPEDDVEGKLLREAGEDGTEAVHKEMAVGETGRGEEPGVAGAAMEES